MAGISQGAAREPKEEGKVSLTSSQQAALEYVTNYARERKAQARQAIGEVLQMANIPWKTYEQAVAKIKSHARVALHFHPDRPTGKMQSVAQALLEQGVYRNQFETGLSNGSVSAYPGGARDLWEKKIFGGAYHQGECPNHERPKYGALDLTGAPDGPAPRFGSCYFLLSPEVSHRSTFTYLDSHQEPTEKGTFAEFDDIMAALLVEVFVRDFAIGVKDLTPTKLINHLLTNLEKPLPPPVAGRASRNLNHYIEAQVHGDVLLARDVDILVADPSFQGTDTGIALEELCSRYDIELLWHMGFAMATDDVPLDFRGPTMPSLARRIAPEGYLTTKMIGDAAMQLKQSPETWSDRGTYREVLQELKLLWHVLVRYGEPLQGSGA